MSQPFGDEKFTFSLFLVFCNRILACFVAIVALAVRVGDGEGAQIIAGSSTPPFGRADRELACAQRDASALICVGWFGLRWRRGANEVSTWRAQHRWISSQSTRLHTGTVLPLPRRPRCALFARK